MVVRVEILCAVLAAAMFGAGHYMSGTASRRQGPVAVAYWTQFGVVAVALTLLLARPVDGWDPAALLWGGGAALGGVVDRCVSTRPSRGRPSPWLWGHPP